MQFVTFAWIVKAYFLEKIRKIKKKSQCRLLSFLPIMLSVKQSEDVNRTMKNSKQLEINSK